MTRIATTAAALFLSFAAAGSAFADDITLDTQPHVSTLTRAAVQAEQAQFKARGVNPWSITYNLRSESRSVASRADVRAEVIAARATGELNAYFAEDSGAAHMAAHAPARATASTTHVASAR